MSRNPFLFAPLIALIVVSGCSARDGPGKQAQGGTAVENATLTKLDLTSTAFADGQPIPRQYSCDGGDRSPPLSWGEPPAGTKSFALIVDDPDAPSGLFRHWGAFDIPASTRSIDEAHPIGEQAINGFGKAGYGGPCPPPGHGPHHYHFKLYALDVAQLGLPAGAKVEQLESEARRHAIAMGELIGTYERK
jgi:Raf kinase inhibitor-like YbhB/YbcL family protein